MFRLRLALPCIAQQFGYAEGEFERMSEALAGDEKPVLHNGTVYVDAVFVERMVVCRAGVDPGTEQLVSRKRRPGPTAGD